MAAAVFTFASDRAGNRNARRLGRDRDLLIDRGVPPGPGDGPANLARIVCAGFTRTGSCTIPRSVPAASGGTSDSACRRAMNERLPELDRGILVVVKRAPVEQVRDGHGDDVRDRVGRGGDEDDRPEARRGVIDQRVGDPAQTLGRVVIAIRRRVEAERVQIPADRFAQQQSQTLTTASPRLADGVGERDQARLDAASAACRASCVSSSTSTLAFSSGSSCV
jgi:hypothetical protein